MTKKETNKVPEVLKGTIRTGIPVHGIAGILLFIVCISVGYNAFLVLAGTDGLTNIIMAVPSVLFIAAFLAYKAWK